MPNTELNIYLRLRDQLSRGLQGIRGRLRAFADSFKRHWLAITAAITGAILALKKAFDWLELGARAEQIQRSFERIAQSVGVNSKKMEEALRRAAAYTINFSNVASSVSALLAQGLNMDQVVKLMEASRAAARVTGETVEAAFNKIASAVTGGFLVTVKRAYGFNVELKQAFEDYAKTMGMTVEEVRQYYKAQALANNIIKAATAYTRAMNMEATTHLEKLQQLRAWWTETKERIGIALWTIIDAWEKFVSTLKYRIAEMVTVIKDLLIKLVRIAIVVSKFLHLPTQKLENMLRELMVTKQAWAEMAETARVELGKITVATENQVIPAVQHINNAAEKATSKLQDTFKIWEELAKNTATNIQNAFSDFFFKAFTGELRNLRDVFSNFGRAMLQSISNILAQIVTYYAFIRPLVSAFPGLAPVFGMGGAGTGGKQLGSPYIPRTGLYLLHRGEKVIPAHEAAGAETQPINIYFSVQAWDAGDVWRNRKVLAGAIAEEIRRNAGIRGVIKQYG